eukprot:scaffold2879_cov269-Prasinococcus_capsulatus_cf.AAC.13
MTTAQRSDFPAGLLPDMDSDDDYPRLRVLATDASVPAGLDRWSGTLARTASFQKAMGQTRARASLLILLYGTVHQKAHTATGP